LPLVRSMLLDRATTRAAVSAEMVRRAAAALGVPSELRSTMVRIDRPFRFIQAFFLDLSGD